MFLTQSTKRMRNNYFRPPFCFDVITTVLEVDYLTSTIREPLDQPITVLTTEQENVYNKRFSQSTPLPDEELHKPIKSRVA